MVRYISYRLGIAFTHLHDGPAVPESHSNTLLVFKSDAPDGLSLSNKLANQVTCLQIPDLDPSIAATTDDTSIVKLQARNTVIVCS